MFVEFWFVCLSHFVALFDGQRDRSSHQRVPHSAKDLPPFPPLSSSRVANPSTPRFKLYLCYARAGTRMSASATAILVFGIFLGSALQRSWDSSWAAAGAAGSLWVALAVACRRWTAWRRESPTLFVEELETCRGAVRQGPTARARAAALERPFG